MRYYSGVAMNKRLFAVLLTLMLVLLLCSCDKESSEKGIIEKKCGDCYIVSLPEGKSVDDFFTLTGECCAMYIDDLGYMDKQDYLGCVKYSKVEEEGWIAFTEYKFLYIPYNVEKTMVVNACCDLVVCGDNIMSLEAAKEFIPFLPK